MKTGIFKNVLIMAISLACIMVNAQDFSLITQSSGAGDERLSNMVTDAVGNIYYSGAYKDSATFEGVQLLPSGITPPSYSDAFLAKHSVSGGNDWAIRIGGTALLFAKVEGLAVDSNGDILFTITAVILADTLRIGDLMKVPANGAQSTGVLVKIDSQGNLLWGKAYQNSPGIGILNGIKIVTDASNNFYFGGFNIGGLSLDTVTLPAGSFANNHFIAKGDENGNFLWARIIEGPGDKGQSISMKISDQNDVFLSGEWSGDTLFAGNQFVVNSNPGGTKKDRYLANVSSNGNFLWIKSEGGADDNWRGLLVPQKNGGLMCFSKIPTGTSIDIDEGNITVQGPAFLFSNYDNQGALVWHKPIPYVATGISYNITGDGSNFYLVSGYSSPQITIGTGSFNNVGATNGTADIALVMFDSTATQIRNTELGSQDGDFVSNLIYSPIHQLLIGGTTNSNKLILGSDSTTNAGLLTNEIFIAGLTYSIGLNPISKINSIGIYPNPTQNNIHFDLPELGAETYKLSVYNSIGQLVASEELSSDTSNYGFNVESLKEGAYFLKISSSSDVYAGTFIKD